MLGSLKRHRRDTPGTVIALDKSICRVDECQYDCCNSVSQNESTFAANRNGSVSIVDRFRLSSLTL